MRARRIGTKHVSDLAGAVAVVALGADGGVRAVAGSGPVRRAVVTEAVTAICESSTVITSHVNNISHVFHLSKTYLRLKTHGNVQKLCELYHRAI